MKYSQLSANNVDSQLLETRKFNVIDIARFFGISPTKLFDYTNSSYATVEATQLAFLTDTLTPILEKFELEFERKMFLPFEQTFIDVKFDTTNILRLDITAQTNYYKTLYTITPNEVRADILKEPLEGSDHAFMQGAMKTVENIINPDNITNEKKF
jgi:HK97 family phage portal protein